MTETLTRETTTPPLALTESLPGRDRAQLRRWWATRSRAQQAELHRLWDPRREDIAWTEPADDAGWEALPIRLQGRTVEDPELGPEGREMKRELLEFILGHEEIGFFLEERHFHICRRHAQARAALASGLLPAGFRCTLRGEDCPMRVISKAAGERAVRIRLRAK